MTDPTLAARVADALALADRYEQVRARFADSPAPLVERPLNEIHALGIEISQGFPEHAALVRDLAAALAAAGAREAELAEERDRLRGYLERTRAGMVQATFFEQNPAVLKTFEWYIREINGVLKEPQHGQ